ncbi:unnamed protein product [Notodromas monacha]|uniref:Large ribosomal subunit protein uL15 n=1 Tax=Notodromas monacha TaxID=399045 RepID=A0A7R9BPA3_9CRUS|nr:unnamed protein product [Notodromas monacha]CAG0917793.1 unnamed protein product [Notodromas monacha]
MGSTNKKKTRKMRGHVSHGHGRIGKHRKHPGGRGNAGGQHHHRINFDKYHPGYFGKIGMRNFHVKASLDWCPIINLDKVWSLVSEQTREKYKNHPDGKAPVIDVVKAGYSKVLGKGLLPKQPVIIQWTPHAAETVASIGRLREDQALVDSIVLCGAEVFQVHKLILSVNSEYFEQLFRRLPVVGNNTPVIAMHQTHPVLFQLILDYIYTGSVEVPFEFMDSFLELGESLLIRGLRAFEHAAFDEVYQSETQVPEQSLQTSTIPLEEVPSEEPRVEQVQPTATITLRNPKKRTSAVIKKRRKRSKLAAMVQVSENKRMLRSAVKEENKRSRLEAEIFTGGDENANELDQNNDEYVCNGEEKNENYVPQKLILRAPSIPEIPSMVDLVSVTKHTFRGLSTSTGTMLYACELCEYRTRQRGSIITHERIHTGERPYNCRINCGKGFSQASSRNLHENRRVVGNWCLAMASSAGSKASRLVRNVKPVMSLDRSEARRRVLGLYKAWYRQIPYVVAEYDIPKSKEQCREKLREQFLQNKDITDIRVIDMLAIKGQMELVETVKMHKQSCHVMAYFKETVNKRPEDFLSKFYAGQ